MSCGEIMLLEFVQHLKSIKAPFLVSADLECLIKVGGSKNNPETIVHKSKRTDEYFEMIQKVSMMYRKVKIV